jgi:predicted transcriptional regulator
MAEYYEVLPPSTPSIDKAPNRQLYENSPLSGSQIEQEAAANSDGFFGAKQPNLAILTEKPQHRMAVYLKATGLSNREIATRLSLSEAWVSQILRQPWAQQQLVKELQLAGRDVVKSVIEASALESVFTLIAIRDDTSNKASTRLAAADSLLDRAIGKAVQRVESDNTHRQIPAEMSALDKELAELESETARLTGKVHDKN